MDLTTLQAQIRASRQITAQAGGASFMLQMPSDHAWHAVVEANRDARGRLLQIQASHAVLSAAITGWEGVTTQHLLPEAPADPLPFSPAARAELLEERQDIADALMMEIGNRLAARREARESAIKNS